MSITICLYFYQQITCLSFGSRLDQDRFENKTGIDLLLALFRMLLAMLWSTKSVIINTRSVPWGICSFRLQIFFRPCKCVILWQPKPFKFSLILPRLSPPTIKTDIIITPIKWKWLSLSYKLLNGLSMEKSTSLKPGKRNYSCS